MKFNAVVYLAAVLLTFLEPSSSQKYHTIDSDVCEKFSLLNLYNKYTFNLVNPVTSVIIEKSFNSSSYKRFKRDCAFKIVSENSGIFINIRKMRLRQNPITGECYDSLLIKYSEDVKHRFCGDLKDQQIKTIEDLRGSVKITLSIDNLRAFTDSKDFLEFSIVATAFTDCKDANYINCKESARSCISNAYVNDGVLNCPAPQCADEDLGCLTEELQEKVKPIDASSIAISAITSLIFTLVMVFTCVWFVWQHKDCCKSTPNHRPNRDRRPNTRHHAENLEIPEPSGSTVSPSAPSIDDKDLPPPYDTLFPER